MEGSTMIWINSDKYSYISKTPLEAEKLATLQEVYDSGLPVVLQTLTFSHCLTSARRNSSGLDGSVEDYFD